MTKTFLILGSLCSGLSVALGAFASHALKERLTEKALDIWETGTRYQMYHSLALILVAILLIQIENSHTFLNVAGWGFFSGILLFSGSLYALSLSNIKILGAITPLGGVAFLVGWISLAIFAFNN